MTDLTPPPMNTMLEKQQRSEARKKKKDRESIPFDDVPPTNPGNIKQNKEIKLRNKGIGYWVILILFLTVSSILTVENQGPSTRKTRAQPKCSICKEPMKGHKNVINCPKNQK